MSIWMNGLTQAQVTFHFISLFLAFLSRWSNTTGIVPSTDCRFAPASIIITRSIRLVQLSIHFRQDLDVLGCSSILRDLSINLNISLGFVIVLSIGKFACPGHQCSSRLTILEPWGPSIHDHSVKDKADGNRNLRDAIMQRRGSP